MTVSFFRNPTPAFVAVGGLYLVPDSRCRGTSPRRITTTGWQTSVIPSSFDLGTVSVGQGGGLVKAVMFPVIFIPHQEKDTLVMIGSEKIRLRYASEGHC
jgi:hypothetical protein